MKVISGPPVNTWTHRFVCKKCKATLLAEKNDIMSDSIDWREPTWYYVICPCCGQKETVKPPN